MNHDHHHDHHVVEAAPSPMVAGAAHLVHAAADTGHGSSHSMAFHFGSMETILFNFWKPMDAAGILLSCLIIAMMCFLMEFVRFIRSYRNGQKTTMQSRLRLEPTISTFVLCDALLNLIQTTLSYLLMLVFMTFNVWLCITVVIGEVASRLLFSILFPYLEMEMVGPC